MNNMFRSKKLIFIVCLLSIGLFVVGCNNNNVQDNVADTEEIVEKPNPFVGTWVMKEFEDFENEEIYTVNELITGLDDDLEAPTIVINPDNTVHSDFFGEKDSTVWEMQDDKTLIIGTGDITDKVVIIDGELVFEDDDAKMTYIRK